MWESGESSGLQKTEVHAEFKSSQRGWKSPNQSSGCFLRLWSCRQVFAACYISVAAVSCVLFSCWPCGATVCLLRVSPCGSIHLTSEQAGATARALLITRGHCFSTSLCILSSCSETFHTVSAQSLCSHLVGGKLMHTWCKPAVIQGESLTPLIHLISTDNTKLPATKHEAMTVYNSWRQPCIEQLLQLTHVYSKSLPPTS